MKSSTNIKNFFNNAINSFIGFVINKKAELICFGIFLLTALPFFILQVRFINHTSTSVIFGDKIGLLANSLDGIMSGSVKLKDFFALHDGFFSPGSVLFLILDVKAIGLDNDYVLALLVPIFILAISAIIWIFGLNKYKELNVRNIVYAIMCGALSSLFMFSVYDYVIVNNYTGFVTFISLIGFFVSILLFQKAQSNEERRNQYIIASTIVGFINSFIFGSVYALAFLIAMLLISIFYFVRAGKQESKINYYYLGSIIAYAVLFLVISIINIVWTSNQNRGNFNLIQGLQMYMYSLSSIFVSPDSIELSNAVLLNRHFIGIFTLFISIISVAIYFKKKYYEQNIFVFFLFLLSQLVLILVVLSKVSTYGPYSSIICAYYPAYVLLIVFIVNVMLTFALGERKTFANTSGVAFISVVAALSLIVGFPQLDFYKKKYDDRGRQDEMVYGSLLYKGMNDQELMDLYNTDANNVRRCFELLEKYSLYTYSDNFTFPEGVLADNLPATSMSAGLYDYGSADRFTSKTAVFYINFQEEYLFELKLYNPDNFKDNSYSVYVNNEALCENVAIASGEVKREIVQFVPGVNRVEISVDHTTCPATEGLSSDPRNLGLLIGLNLYIDESFTDNLQYAGITSGLYDYGSEERFTDKKAIFYLKLNEARKYDLTLYNPDSFKDNKYTILVNKEVISENVNIAKGELKIESLSLKAGINKIEIRLDNTTCPKDEGISDDPRNLGLLIGLKQTN